MPVNFDVNDILKLIEKSKEQGVKKIDIKKDGSISVEFNEGERKNSPVTKQELAEMEKISMEATEEEEMQITQQQLEELAINNPQELERLIETGYVEEDGEGNLIPISQ